MNLGNGPILVNVFGAGVSSSGSGGYQSNQAIIRDDIINQLDRTWLPNVSGIVVWGYTTNPRSGRIGRFPE